MSFWSELKEDLKHMFIEDPNKPLWTNPQMSSKQLLEYIGAHGIELYEDGTPVDERSAKLLKKLIEKESRR